ncbi:MAG: hypothetical protein U9R50_00320 [Campylobacterota bacterium]|nr:hypothetical protein [Campylobacterota bacterium]
MSSALDRLKDLTSKISSYEVTRKENLLKLEQLYHSLHVSDKVDIFNELFEFKAINLSGIALSSDNLGAIQEGKYIQIIAISYDSEAVVKNKNTSLAYFGRSDKIEDKLRYDIITFVLAWRFEKSFRTLEHYNGLIKSLPKDIDA